MITQRPECFHKQMLLKAIYENLIGTTAFSFKISDRFERLTHQFLE